MDRQVCAELSAKGPWLCQPCSRCGVLFQGSTHIILKNIHNSPVKQVSIQFSCSVMSDSATPWPAALQASLSITNSGACSNSCPSSQWCHPTISCSVAPFSSCLQSFPASGPFPMSQLFASGGQSIGVSASASVFNEYSGLISFGMNWFDLLAVQGTLKSLLQHHSSKASNLRLSLYSNSHIHTWLLVKPYQYGMTSFD